MKKLFAAFIVLILFQFSNAQSSYFTISGKVLDAETKLPMQGASVFAENTTLGTTTGRDGTFALQLPNGGYDLVISFTGYNTESKHISNNEQAELSFFMNPKEKLLQTVSVAATGEVKDGWEKYGSFFLEQFIGKTSNSSSCSIKNADVLKFFFSKKRNRLKVLASEPLLIENNALGYNIRYTLDSFTHEYSNQVSLYTGYPLFEEKTPASESEGLKWKTARQKAYNGSVLHFMRSVYNRDMSEQGFEVQYIVKINEQDSALKLKNFYSALNYKKDDSTAIVQIMPNQQRLGVIFVKEKPDPAYLTENPADPSDFQFSLLSFLPGKQLTIEQNGYYSDQNDVTINEYWSWTKMADALPYDYVITP